METDPMRMCALLVGLPDVTVIGVGEWPKWLRVEVATNLERPSCCGRAAWHHDSREVVLVDLPVFGRPARLVWHKQRWRCPVCRRTWTEQHRDRIGPVCAHDTGGDTGGEMGDAAGRPARPLGGRSRCRAGRVRDAELHPLPDPFTALRRQAQLGPPGNLTPP